MTSGLDGSAQPIGIGLELLRLEQAEVSLEERITALFEQLRGPVYRYLCASYGNPADAEEITQDAFLRLYDALREGKAILNVRAWVFRVAHNLALNRLRHDRFVEPMTVVSWEDLCRVREDPAPDPEQGVLERERMTRLRAGLAQLSNQQRQCLVLRVEGFRYREIAEILSITTSTVAESLRRGVKKLMKDVHD